ncbi:MAG: hypothetical protein GAK41_00660 [Burkholderia gladioli]|nr:MAG: hypothetical protein GAK41_00660 [Burkholderia gladioli]
MAGHEAVVDLGRTHVDADHVGNGSAPIGATRAWQTLVSALLKFEWVKRAAGVRKPTSQNGILAPPQGGEVLAAGRVRGPGGAKLCLARALKRARRFLRIKGSLRRASPALDPEKSTHSKFKRGRFEAASVKNVTEDPPLKREIEKDNPAIIK